MEKQRLREVRGREKGGEAKLERSRQPRKGGWWAKVRRWDEIDGSEKRGCKKRRRGEGREKAGGSGNVKRGEVEECLRGEGVRRRHGEEIRLNKRWRDRGNVRFESCILQSELLQTVGLADCVENLVHHLRPLETNEPWQKLVTRAFHLKWNKKKNLGRESEEQAVIR